MQIKRTGSCEEVLMESIFGLRKEVQIKRLALWEAMATQLFQQRKHMGLSLSISEILGETLNGEEPGEMTQNNGRKQ